MVAVTKYNYTTRFIEQTTSLSLTCFKLAGSSVQHYFSRVQVHLCVCSAYMCVCVWLEADVGYLLQLLKIEIYFNFEIGSLPELVTLTRLTSMPPVSSSQHWSSRWVLLCLVFYVSSGD